MKTRSVSGDDVRPLRCVPFPNLASTKKVLTHRILREGIMLILIEGIMFVREQIRGSAIHNARGEVQANRARALEYPRPFGENQNRAMTSVAHAQSSELGCTWDVASVDAAVSHSELRMV